jgi:VCBS repeat-containing protein
MQNEHAGEGPQGHLQPNSRFDSTKLILKTTMKNSKPNPRARNKNGSTGKIRFRTAAILILLALASTAVFSAGASASSLDAFLQNNLPAPLASGLSGLKQSLMQSPVVNFLVDEAATIKTDKSDYAPGETAVITGTGFQPYERVTLQVIHIEGIAEDVVDHYEHIVTAGEGHEPWTVTADENGSVNSTWYVHPDDSLGATFLLTAVGEASGRTARYVFTDGSIAIFAEPGAHGGSAPLVTTTTVTIIKYPSAVTDCITNQNIPGTTETVTNKKSPGGLGIGNGVGSIRLTANLTSTSGANFTQWRSEKGDDAFVYMNGNTPSQEVTTSICFADGGQRNHTFYANYGQVQQTGTSLVVNSATGPFGGTVNLTATSTAGGVGVANQTVNFAINGKPAGSAVTNALGVATVSNVALTDAGGVNIPAGTYPGYITAVSDDVTNLYFGATAPAQTLTVTAPSNTAPVASGAAETVSEDTAKTITLSATDAEGNALTYAIVANPSHGTVTLSGNIAEYTAAANYNGADSFTFKANDGTADSNVATVSLTVSPVNDTPAADSQTVTTDEDTAKSIALTGSDIDLDALTFSVVAGPAHGTLSGTGASLTYTPAANFHGNDSFTFKANDGAADSPAATVSITVAPLNDAPSANDDALTTDEDTAANFNVLANDSDVEGDAFNVTSVTQGAKGAVAVNANNTVTYTPNLNVNGADSFTYSISDGNGGNDTATVSVTINAVNDAPTTNNDSYSVDEDQPLTVNAAGVLANDTDVEGSALTAVLVNEPANGSLTLNADGSFTYTPQANFNGSDSFTYKAGDGTENGNAASVSITVNAVNDAPAANAQTIATDEDAALNVVLTGTDVDGNALNYTVVTGPTKGILSGTGANLTYTPNANFYGSDSFTFKVNDGTADSASTATVSITVNPVNDAPAAANDTTSTNEDVPVNVSVLVNDADVDGDTLAVTNVTQGAKGSVTINADKTISYAPAANLNGSDSFTYTVGDGQGGTATATVSVTITAVNDNPTVSNGSLQTDEDTPSALFPLTGSDVDGDPLTYTIVAGPAHGAFAGGVYTPTANFNGSDSFTFKANDGTADSNVATVSITVVPVNDAPTANGQSATTNEDVAKSITLTGGDVDNPSAALNYAVGSQPANGTVSCAGASCTYTPSANYFGADSFTFTVSDGSLESSAATVSITVISVNDNPVANGDSATVDEDTASNAIAVLGNDNIGPDTGETLAVTAVGAAAHGTTAFTATGVTYTPAADYYGADSFTYTIGDGNGGTATATVSVTVTNVNDNPVAVADTKSATEDTVLSFAAADLVANDTDADNVAPTAANQGLSVAAVTTTADTNGGVVLIGQTISYSPAANFYGTASFTYTLTDGLGGTTSGTVTVNVSNVNDAPVAVSDVKSTNEDVQLVLSQADLKGNDTDIDNTNAQLSVTGVSNASNGSVGIVNGNIVFTPTANFYGAAGFSYTLSDGDKTALGAVTVNVLPVNDPPVLTLSAASATAQYSDYISEVTVTAEDIDTPTSSLTISLDSALPNDLTLTQVGAGQAKVSGRLNVAPGQYLPKIKVSDGALTDVETLTVNVTQEDAKATYTGQTFASTGSATGTTANVQLSATIQDITLIPSSNDPNAGDIRNAKVTFALYNGSSFANIAGCIDLPVGLVSGGDLQTGTATCNWAANIGSTDSTQYTVATIVTNYYKNNSVEGTEVVTVSKSIGSGFITGGGYLILSNAAGIKGGDVGSRNNFGFNVKYNKSGTSLQGNINTIVRRTENGVLRVYQIKGNVMTSLSVNPSTGCATATATKPCTAVFTGKANIQDITNPLAPVSVDGNGSLKVTMTDRGEPGTTDAIGITLLNKDGGVWFSSSWDGVKTIEQVLKGGNLVVH